MLLLSMFQFLDVNKSLKTINGKLCILEERGIVLSFIIIHCYDCSYFINILLYLVYKLNFTRGQKRIQSFVLTRDSNIHRGS